MSAGLTRTRTWIIGAGVAVAVLLACGASQSSSGSGTNTKASGAPSVQIHLKVPNDTFIVGEDIALTVSVTNDATSDVSIPDPFHRDNWQPTYTLTGPSSPSQTFSFRSVALKDTRPSPDDVEPVLITLHPGQTVQTDVPLRSWATVNEPGAYQISAKLAWNGVAAQSAPVQFEVQRATVQSASVGIDVGAAGTPGDWLEWFKKEASGERLYSAMFKRPRIDVRGYDAFSVQPIFMAGAQATDLLSPWTNYDRQSELVKWRVWREGSALVGLVTGLPDPHRLDLGSVPERVVRPALMTKAGELDVFVLSAQSTVSLAHFPPPNFDGASPPAKVAWKTTVPGAPIAARAALAPEQAGNGRRLLVVTREVGALAVHFMNAGNGAAVGKWQSVRVPNVTAMRGVEPALMVGDDGTARAAVMVETNATTHDFGVVDLTFDREGKPVGAPAVTPLGRLTAAPRAAAATYTVTPDAMRRDWFVLLENGSAIHSGSAGKTKQLRLAPLVPLQLVALSAGTYFLALDANGKPEFVLLD